MSKIYLSELAQEPFLRYLLSKGHTIEKIPSYPHICSGISSHADLFFCDLGGRLFRGDPLRVGASYPADIPYNACSTGRYFIHNLKYTDPLLLETARKSGQILIHVSQGYARCSCLPINETSVITADRGIAAACRKSGLDVLLIETGHILLPGYPWGFIGGTAGKIGKEILFHGDLFSHPNGTEIRDFIEERGLKVIRFSCFPLTDIGSIFEGNQAENPRFPL